LVGEPGSPPAAEKHPQTLFKARRTWKERNDVLRVAENPSETSKQWVRPDHKRASRASSFGVRADPDKLTNGTN